MRDLMQELSELGVAVKDARFNFVPTAPNDVFDDSTLGTVASETAAKSAELAEHDGPPSPAIAILAASLQAEHDLRHEVAKSAPGVDANDCFADVFAPLTR